MEATFSHDHLFSDRKEELLLKYFDSTLSPEELLEFAQFRVNAPEIDREINEMEVFDAALERSHFDNLITDDIIDNDFILQMQQHYKTIVATPTSTPIESSILTDKSGTWIGSSIVWKLPFIVAVSGLSLYGIYSLTLKKDLPQSSTNLISTHSQTHNITTNLQKQEPNVASPDLKPLSPTIQPKSMQAPQSAKENSSDLADIQAKVSIQQFSKENKIESTIEQYSQNIQQHYREGNPIGAALAEKSVGVLYRELGKYSESITLLEKSLKTLKEAKLSESEGDVLGELALTYKNMGNIAKSQQYFQDCLDLLQRCNSKNFEYWKKISLH